MTTEANGLQWCGECISAHEHPNDPSSRCYTCKRRRGFVKAETHAEGSVNPQKRIAALESQLAECKTLIEKLFKAVHMLIGDETDWWDGEAVEKWDALVAEWQAMKGGEE